MAQNNSPNPLQPLPLSHELAAENHEWSFADNMSFESALALNWSSVNAMTPTNTDNEIELIKHYNELEADLDQIQIEAGVYDAEMMTEQFYGKISDDGGRDFSHQVKKKKVVSHWTKQEHIHFLKGLKEHGKKWKTIAKEYVRTKDHIQVASHAQKYFKRQEQHAPGEGKNSKRKKRTSIHDITLETLASDVINLETLASDVITTETLTSDVVVNMPAPPPPHQSWNCCCYYHDLHNDMMNPK